MNGAQWLVFLSTWLRNYTKKRKQKHFYVRKFGYLEKLQYLCTRFLTKRSLRLSVRTRDFHSLKRSSTLLGTTIVKSVICTAKCYHQG